MSTIPNFISHRIEIHLTSHLSETNYEVPLFGKIVLIVSCFNHCPKAFNSQECSISVYDLNSSAGNYCPIAFMDRQAKKQWNGSTTGKYLPLPSSKKYSPFFALYLVLHICFTNEQLICSQDDRNRQEGEDAYDWRTNYIVRPVTKATPTSRKHITSFIRGPHFL